MIKNLIQEYEEGLAQLAERYSNGQDKMVFKIQMDNYKVFINSLKKLENDYKIVILEHENEIKQMEHKMEQTKKTVEIANYETIDKIKKVLRTTKTINNKYDLICDIIRGPLSE